MQETLGTWSKESSNIVYEAWTAYIFRFFFRHGDVLLVWVN